MALLFFCFLHFPIRQLINSTETIIVWLPFPSQFFVLDVYNSDGTPLTVDQIYMQLEKIWNTSLQTNKEPVGILTSQHRNTWGKAYNNLIKGEERH